MPDAAAQAPQNLTGNLTLKPSSPDASWPANGGEGRLAPKLTASITEEESVNGVKFKLKLGSATAQISNENSLWVGPGNGVNGTWSITNTAADETPTQLRISCTWQPVRGQGGGSGGGTSPDDIPGTGYAFVDLLDSKAVWRFDPLPVDEQNVLKSTPAANGDANIIRYYVDFQDSAGRAPLRVDFQKVTAQDYSDVEPSQWQNDPWIVEGGSAQVGVAQVTGNIRSAHASIGKLKAEWNDGSEESAISDRKLNFARIKIVTSDGREYPDLWYFGSGVSVPNYPSVENMTATVLPPKWAQSAGNLSWSVVAGQDKVKATALNDTGTEKKLTALGPSGQKNDCEIEVTSAQCGLNQRLKFDVESFGQAVYWNLARGNSGSLYQTTLIYTVPTNMGRFKKQNLSAREIFDLGTRTTNTAYPNCTWQAANNGQVSPLLSRFGRANLMAPILS